METKNIKCPNCNAPLNVNRGEKFHICPSCDSKIEIVDDSVKTTHQIIDENKNVTNRIIDEVGLKKLEIEQERLRKAEEKEQQTEKETKKINLILLISWIASLIIFLVVSLFTMDSVNFSPFQLVLILDIIVGIVVIKKRSKKS